MTIKQQLPPEKIRIFALQAQIDQNEVIQSLDFEEKLALLLEVRTVALDEHLENLRLTVRDMLRNGTYKPTGRAKPASEYLLNAALTGTFPRINPVVDICNFISLKYLVPVSLWDLDLAGADEFIFRLGMDGESYIFNPAGQSLDLKDLLCGFSVTKGLETAIVTPVKDSLRTKTTGNTRNVAAVLYWPGKYRDGIFTPEAVVAEFCDLVKQVCGGRAALAPVEMLS